MESAVGGAYYHLLKYLLSLLKHPEYGDFIYNSKVLCCIHFTDRHESILNIRNSIYCCSKWSHFDSPDLSVCMVKLWLFWCPYGMYISDNVKNWYVVYKYVVYFLCYCSVWLNLFEISWLFNRKFVNESIWLLMKIHVHMQEVKCSNLWHRLLHELIGICARCILPNPTQIIPYFIMEESRQNELLWEHQCCRCEI